MAVTSSSSATATDDVLGVSTLTASYSGTLVHGSVPLGAGAPYLATNLLLLDGSTGSGPALRVTVGGAVTMESLRVASGGAVVQGSMDVLGQATVRASPCPALPPWCAAGFSLGGLRQSSGRC